MPKSMKTTTRESMSYVCWTIKSTERDMRFWFNARHNMVGFSYAECRKRFLIAKRNRDYYMRILVKQSTRYVNYYENTKMEGVA